MSKHEEDRQILSAARGLGRINPHPRATEEALDKVRARLQVDEDAIMHRGRRLLIMSGGIAAAAAIGITVIAITAMSPRAVNAAQELNDIAAATGNYKGWVHVRPIEKWHLGLTTQPVLQGIHINTNDGTVAVVFRWIGMLNIQMTVPSRHERQMYMQMGNQIRIMNADEESSQRTMKIATELPLKLADYLAQFKTAGLKQPDVVEAEDKGLRRFTVTFKDATDKIPEEYRAMAASTLIVWADPQTKMIRRMQTPLDGRPTLMEYTYGAPEIHDMHDLGAPANARVVDDRAPANAVRPAVLDLPRTDQLVDDNSIDLKTVQDRIQKRINADFGDYIAIECEEQRTVRRGSHRQGNMTLQARHDNKRFSATYLLAPEMAFFGGPGFPEGWPNPKLPDALAIAQTGFAVRAQIFDGDRMWDGQQRAGVAVLELKPTIQHVRIVGTFPGDLGLALWPMPTTGPAVIPATTIQTRRDPDHPGLIVLHTLQTMSFPGNGAATSYKSETTSWIDPARDDLVVESVTRAKWNNEKNDTIIHEIFLDYAKLADGRWFPNHWQQAVLRSGTTLPDDWGNYSDHWRQIFQNARLDDDWYSNPDKHLRHESFFPASAPTTTPTH
jgi:hypothetical protein